MQTLDARRRTSHPHHHAFGTGGAGQGFVEGRQGDGFAQGQFEIGGVIDRQPVTPRQLQQRLAIGGSVELDRQAAIEASITKGISICALRAGPTICPRR